MKKSLSVLLVLGLPLVCPPFLDAALSRSAKIAVSASALDLPEAASADAVALPKEADMLGEKKVDEVGLPHLETTTSTLDPTVKLKAKSRWRPLNFILGAVGGALVGGYIGFIKSSGPGGLDDSLLEKNLAIYGAAGVVGGSLFGGLFGALVAPPPPPPSARGPFKPILALRVLPRGAKMALGLAF